MTAFVTDSADLELARTLWGRVAAEHPGRVRIDVEKIIEVAARLVRERGLSVRPSDLATRAVRVLRDQGELSLPSDRTAAARKANYDRRCDPPLPLFVMVARPAVERQAVERAMAPRREHPWHPDLGFLAGERRLECADVWLAIDAWLKERGDDTDVVAVRERSCEIFGDEKRLDDVRNYKFFKTGAITLGRLRCEDAPEPLAAWLCRPSRARVALVVENKDTFRSACLANAGAHAYAAVIFGEGNAFPKRVPDLKNLAEECAFDEVHYFGDIDGEGFSIAASAEQAVLSLGGFSFRLATELYRALRAAGRPVGSFGRIDAAGQALLHRYGLADMDAEALAGRRIPQEALARPALQAIFLRMTTPPPEDRRLDFGLTSHPG
jgi:hypothetical protein